MAKKAQGMSMNTIIIAIIVLIVLVVLVMIFTGYFGGWTKGVARCQAGGGTCTDVSTCVSIIDDPANAEAKRIDAPTGACFGSSNTPLTSGDQYCCPPGTKPDKT
jgi:hypothetical protein